MKKIILYQFQFFFLIFFINNAFSEKIVYVGAYHFPPFFNEQLDSYGISLELIEAMNKFQNKYNFKLFVTSSKRRFSHFDSGLFDLIMFENLAWGWKDKDVAASNVFFKGGAVYIAKADGKKNQNYFDNFKGKRLLGILGYHYGFANFISDEEYLKKKFNAYMTSTHDGNIISIVQERADIAVVVKAYLQKYLHDNPGIKGNLLISNKYDAVNYYTVLIRKNIKPDVNEINILLDDLKKNGILDSIWKKNGIKSD